METSHTVKVLESSSVSPPPGTVADATLPLTFFDVAWVILPPVQRIFFYEYAYPTTEFMFHLLPQLKNSLSLALQHFYPLAGKLTTSPVNGENVIHFAEGDSVQLIVAESDSDFHQLVIDNPKDAADFHHLVPNLPTSALLALQVTIFPKSGICIGLILHHVVADGRSMAHFMKSWASTCRTGLASSISSLPSFDRSAIVDRQGLKKIFLEDLKEMKVDEMIEKVEIQEDPRLATFVLGRPDIERLRHWVLASKPDLAHCTPFVLTCAHVWVCLLKTHHGDIGDKTDHFVFSVDCRARLDPPAPVTYFGNCLGGCFVEGLVSDLIGEDGVATAAELIGEAIYRLREGVLVGAEGWIKKFRLLAGKHIVSIAGSPKFRVYDTDFGWGRPRKTEVISIAKTGAIYLGESRDGEGIEIGVALPKCEIEAFASAFEQGLIMCSTP